MSAIKITGLVHRYKKEKALDYVNLEVQKTGIFALLGQNGAGKTTLMKSILGLLSPENGVITINEYSSEKARLKGLISYLPERFTFYKTSRVKDIIELYKKLYLINGRDSLDTQALLDKLKIADLGNKKMGELSKGQCQRVGICCLIAGRAPIMLLDEPFSGLDPIGIKDLKSIIRELAKEGNLIFLNSHILSEVESLCESFAIIDKGKILVQGNKKDLLNTMSLENFFEKTVKENEEEK